jgi:hypothetical protein
MNNTDDNDAAAPGRDTSKVRPTLLIGLGGTGGDVLLRVRKRFFEKYGNLEEFPIVAYLWIDTDRTEKQVIARQFTESVSFRDPERLMTTIQRTTDITGHLDDKPDYANIREWWYPGLHSVPSLIEGAGQVRAYSRLGFFQYFDAIQKRIASHMDQIGNPLLKDRMQRSQIIRAAGGVRFESGETARVNVYIICSLAGGTGSGAFLDTAFLVKERHQNADVVGYLLLPRFFGREARMDANGYAALKELDYYSSDDHPFDVQWNSKLRRESIPPPPFSYCYLLDSTNKAGQVVGGAAGSREAVLEMLADNIFKDFTHGQFADQKRGCRRNISSKVGGPVIAISKISGLDFKQTFPKRFYSLGMASIVMPHDRIITGCGYRLGAEIVDFWGGLSSAAFPPASLTEVVREQILLGAGISRDVIKGQQRNDLVLAVGADKAGGQLAAKLESWCARAAERVFQGIPQQNRKTIRQYLEQDEIEAAKNLFAAEDKSARQEEWGDVAGQVYYNGEALKKKAAQALETAVLGKVKREECSIAYAAALLRQVAFVLRDAAYPYIPRLEKEALELEAKIPKAQKASQDALDSMAQHERRGNWDGRKRIILAYDLDCWQRAIVGSAREPGYFRLLLMSRVLRTAAAVCRYLIDYLEGRREPGELTGGLVGRLERINENLKSFKQRLIGRHAHFRDNRPADLSLVLYDSSRFEEIYTRYAGAGDDTANRDSQRAHFVVAASKQVLQDWKIPVTEMPDLSAGDRAQQLEDLILSRTRPLFDAIRSDFHVVREFQKLSRADRIAHLKLMDAKAGALISGTHPNAAHFDFEDGTQLRVVGVPAMPQLQSVELSQAIENAREELFGLLQKELGIARDSCTEIPDSSEIIFYNELGGFPINYISEVARLRDNYEVLSPFERLHIICPDRKFQDVMVMDDQRLQNLIEACDCLLLGCMFGVIRPEPTDEQIHYHWTEVIGINEYSRSLGDRAQALDELSKGDKIRSILFQRFRKKLDFVKGSRELLPRYYVALNFEHARNESAPSSLPQMVLDKVIIRKQEEAVTAAVAASFGWGTPEDFKDDALSNYKPRLDEFTRPLRDGGRLLVLEETSAAAAGR